MMDWYIIFKQQVPKLMFLLTGMIKDILRMRWGDMGEHPCSHPLAGVLHQTWEALLRQILTQDKEEEGINLHGWY